MLNELVRPPTIRETLVDTLQSAILKGELKQGHPLREEELSNSLKVARGTLREAFQILQKEGLVEIFPHRGAFVTTLSLRKIEEIYSFRQLVEPYAVGLAMERNAYGEQDLEELEALLRRMAEYEQRDDGFRLKKTDVDFHYQICKPSDHQLLLGMLKNIQSLTLLCVMNFQYYDPNPTLQEPLHREILNLILSGDCVHTQNRIREHLGAAKSELLAGLEAATVSSQ